MGSIEVFKIIIPRLKKTAQQANPMKVILKGLNSPQRKMMVSPKDLKPKIHERTGLRTYETKGRKKRPSLSRSDDQIEFSGKNWAGIPRGCQGLEILRTCSTTEVGLRLLKEYQKHKERRTDVSFLSIQ